MKTEESLTLASARKQEQVTKTTGRSPLKTTSKVLGYLIALPPAVFGFFVSARFLLWMTFDIHGPVAAGVAAACGLFFLGALTLGRLSPLAIDFFTGVVAIVAGMSLWGEVLAFFVDLGYLPELEWFFIIFFFGETPHPGYETPILFGSFLVAVTAATVFGQVLRHFWLRQSAKYQVRLVGETQ